MKNLTAHAANDGTIAFKDAFSGRVIAYSAWAGFVAHAAATYGWKAYGSPTSPDGSFIAVRPSYSPEDLPVDPGFNGWMRMSVDDLMDFATSEMMVN